MKTKMRIARILFMLAAVNGFALLALACMTPAERAETRQKTRVEERTENRMERRRGGDD